MYTLSFAVNCQKMRRLNTVRKNGYYNDCEAGRFIQTTLRAIDTAWTKLYTDTNSSKNKEQAEVYSLTEQAAGPLLPKSLTSGMLRIIMKEALGELGKWWKSKKAQKRSDPDCENI